jgi:hypothetical protein
MGRLPALRRVQLAGGRVLTVRRIDRRDLAALARLYGDLDDESRYRRFFSVHHPGRAFFERMVAVGERGGAGLVAVVTGHRGGRGRLVGEASYELLANGDGELGITVEAGWRGWLGAYLLDALAEVAAAAGVPNLEAEVLLVNGPMLALVRSRGYATLPSADWSIVRVLVSTAPRADGDEHPRPTWPAGRGLRVLVEGGGGRWHAQPEAAAAGIELVGCPGPGGRGGPTCPALRGRPCPLVAGADVVVLAHPPDRDDWAALRESHARLHPGVPVCVELRPRQEPVGAEVEAPRADVVRFVERLARSAAAPTTSA